MKNRSEKFSSLSDVNDILSLSLADDMLSSNIKNEELSIRVQRNSIQKIIKFLKEDTNTNFNQLVDIFGVDYPNRDERFEVKYNLLSMTNNLRISVSLSVGDGVEVPTISGIHSCADWFEREVWDMYGISFLGHPDLRRILTDYGFEGHPQRKDFPLSGYVELRYDDEKKRVVYDQVKLTQQYRNFDFISPWEGAENAHKQIILPGDEKAVKDE